MTFSATTLLTRTASVPVALWFSVTAADTTGAGGDQVAPRAHISSALGAPTSGSAPADRPGCCSSPRTEGSPAREPQTPPLCRDDCGGRHCTDGHRMRRRRPQVCGCRADPDTHRVAD